MYNGKNPGSGIRVHNQETHQVLLGKLVLKTHQ